MFVYFMSIIDLIICAFRANMCTTERENKKNKTEVHTMKKIELFERAIAEKAGSLKEWGINPTLFWAYRNSITATEINFQ